VPIVTIVGPTQVSTCAKMGVVGQCDRNKRAMGRRIFHLPPRHSANPVSEGFARRSPTAFLNDEWEVRILEQKRNSVTRMCVGGLKTDNFMGA